MRICWVANCVSTAGNAIGYTRASQMLRLWSALAGAEHDPAARLAFHLLAPWGFEPIPGRLNVLYTMWEVEDLPSFLVDALNRADAIITPTRWNADVFARHTDRPVYVVPLGVDVNVFRAISRARPRERPFRWLWVGAHNARKGFQQVQEAWETLRHRGDCELYLKVSDQVPRGEAPYQYIGGGHRMHRDMRKLSDAEMVDQIYHPAHGFVFPSFGEGWGLSPCEAAATGLPCIVPLHTGLTGFLDEDTCLPVAYTMRPIEIDYGAVQDEFGTARIPARRQTVQARVTIVRDLVRTMRLIMDHWEDAATLGQRAAARMQQFTWQAAGRTLVATLGHLLSEDHAGRHLPLPSSMTADVVRSEREGEGEGESHGDAICAA